MLDTTLQSGREEGEDVSLWSVPEAVQYRSIFMASVIPSKPLEAIAFFESHVPVWNASAVQIGLSVAAVTAIDNATKAARTGYENQQVAKNASKSATQAYGNLVSTMRDIGGDGIATIKAFADSTNNPAVYTLAQIPEPAAPTPAAPPTQPTNFKVELTSEGGIVISWKGTGSGGGYYSVKRKLAGESAFTLIGNTGSKSFVDATLTQGTTGASYIIQGFRGQTPGKASDQLTIQFGVAGPGFTVSANTENAQAGSTTTTTERTSVKMAA